MGVGALDPDHQQGVGQLAHHRILRVLGSTTSQIEPEVSQTKLG
jgi:hypothetical protein